jgi:AraC family transcriptional regulator
MRSEYSWLPPHDDVDQVTVTKPNQIGVAFSQHRRVVVQRQGRTAELNVAAGSVFVTGQDPLTWARVWESTDALEIYPDLTLLADLAAGLRSGSGAIQIEPATAAQDAVVLGIASVLRRAHLTGIPPSDLRRARSPIGWPCICSRRTARCRLEAAPASRVCSARGRSTVSPS